MAFLKPAPLLRKLNTVSQPAVCRPPSSPFPNVGVRSLKSQTGAFSSDKTALLEELRPLNFGRAVLGNEERQQKIDMLARNMEAHNPSPAACKDENISGDWDLIYTTSSSILNPRLPAFLQSRRIVQEIDAATLSGRNVEYFKLGPIEYTNDVTFIITPVTENRLEVRFTQFHILGFFTIDVQKNKERFTRWLEVTYLDKDLRISRGNYGNLFVLIKK